MHCYLFIQSALRYDGRRFGKTSPEMINQDCCEQFHAHCGAEGSVHLWMRGKLTELEDPVVNEHVYMPTIF